MKLFSSRPFHYFILLLCPLFFFLYYLSGTQSEFPLPKHRIASYLQSFPSSPDEIRFFTKKAIKDFDSATDTFIHIAIEDRSFENTVQLWDKIGKSFINKMIVLKSTPIYCQDQESIKAAEEQFTVLLMHLEETLRSNPQILLSIVSFLEKASTMQDVSSSQWHYIKQLAESINSKWFPSPLQEKVDSLKSELAQKTYLPYTYRQGSALPKKLLAEKEILSFTLMNLNVCFLPEKLPLLFGGVIPWSHRIEPLSQKILSLSPDVLCLQEVFEEEAAEKLYELLKDTYAYFYLNIAPKNFGFSEHTAGLNSGLFIASKLPLDSPAFTLFTGTTLHMNRGVFQFAVMDENKPLAHVYTTHLEAFSTPPGPEFRKVQLGQILDKIKLDFKQKPKTPIIVCGDLNIPWSSKEPAELLLKAHFHDAYNHERTDLSLNTRTYVDYTDLWWKAKLKQEAFTPIPEILDYALLLDKHPAYNNASLKSCCQIQTVVVPMNEIQDPFSALSDHHGQISTITVKR